MLNKLSDNPEYNPVLIKTNNAEKTELKKRSPADGQKKTFNNTLASQLR